MQGTPAGFPPGIPATGLLIEIAMQHAPHFRHCTPSHPFVAHRPLENTMMPIATMMPGVAAEINSC